MAVSAAALRTHLDYTAFASRRLLDAAANLSPEELTRDFHTADHSVLGTLAHIYAADRVWIGRIQGHPPRKFLDPEVDLHLPVLQTDWPLILDRWKDWAMSLTDDSVRNSLAFTDLKGNQYEQPIWQIVLHLVNHGTHHRGQVSGMLRTMGHTPPPLDLIAYYRSV